ncbi:MAG: 6-phosphogluconolactonase [Ferruginibacter sp.]
MTTSSTYKLEIFITADAFNKAAAEFIIDEAHKAIAVKGRFTLSLSGGQTPENLYRLLAEPAFSKRMPWKNSFIFWGDERCVPLDDDRNNAHQAKILLLDKIDIPASNIHIIPVNLPPAEAACQYEKIVKEFFKDEPMRFDLILLGLGENGHTASLFPGTEIIKEQTAGVREVYVEEEKMSRISMTPYLLNLSHNIIFLVTGKAKAEILNTVLHDAYQPDKYPAQLIKPADGNLYWFVDNEAAAMLP